jgi:FixJ family two-component response regulator
MPEMDGFELMEMVRAENPEPPIIVISGEGERGDVIKALRPGARDYLYKPIENASFLFLAIDRALEKANLLIENRLHRERLEEMVAEKSAELTQQQQVLEDKAMRLEKSDDQFNRIIASSSRHPILSRSLSLRTATILSTMIREVFCNLLWLHLQLKSKGSVWQSTSTLRRSG